LLLLLPAKASDFLVQKLRCEYAIGDGYVVKPDILFEGCMVFGLIVLFPEVEQYQPDGVVVLLLHFLMVASALFCFAHAHEAGHAFEDPVQASHLPVQEVAVVNLQKPVVAFVLLG
jgi:hypothetical protein